MGQETNVILNCVEYTQYLRDYYWINWLGGLLLAIGIIAIVILAGWFLNKKLNNEVKEKWN